MNNKNNQFFSNEEMEKIFADVFGKEVADYCKKANQQPKPKVEKVKTPFGTITRPVKEEPKPKFDDSATSRYAFISECIFKYNVVDFDYSYVEYLVVRYNTRPEFEAAVYAALGIKG